MMIKPMLAEPSFISATFLLLLCILVFVAVIAGIIALVVLIVRLFKKPAQKNQPLRQPPLASKTQVLPCKCPQCGAVLQPDAPEGLCPACLLQRGMGTEGGAPPGTPPFVPPTIPDLAKLFPQLEILELIGKGGMGAVYKARQPALDRFVALKILAPRSGGDVDFAGRFNREARALARLSHPNIVGVYDFGIVAQASSLSAGTKEQTGWKPVPLNYFIMEFVDGPNLRQAGKLTPREAMEIIPQICTALQFAHDEGIVHRDIKPENILLDKKGRVKIADFGLAKILGQGDFRLTGAKDIMGTPHYMAPEQVERPQDVDHRADIYSLGVVFYEMLTGELPLGKFQSPSQKVQVDVRLDEVVLRSLAKEPELRYQHVSEVGTRVETIATTLDPGSSRREEAQTENGKAKRSRPWRRGLFTAFGVFVTVFVASVVCAYIMPEMFVGTARVKINDLPGKTEDTGSLHVYQETFTIQSSPVLKETAAALKLRQRWAKKYQKENLSDQETLELMKNRLMVQAVHDTRLVEIRCYSDAAAEAAEIANKIAETYRALPPGNRGEILDRAFPTSRPIRPNRPLIIVSGFLLGLGAGVFFGLLVGTASWLRSRASVPPRLSPPPKPDHFWRKFAVVVVALVSIPFVIALLGMLAAIAIPNFVKARQRAQENAARQNFVRQIETNPPSASAETWSPTLAPDEKPDLQKILQDAKDFMAKEQYEDALQRHLWYHNHALAIDPGQSGVRLSFALSDWIELGRHYQKAKLALMEIRDRKTRELTEGRGFSEMFQEVAAINHEFQVDGLTVELFKTLRQNDHQLAQQAYFYAEDMLVDKGEYALCLELLGSPQQRFDSIHQTYVMMLDSHERLTESRQKMAQQIAEIIRQRGVTNLFTPPDNSEMMKQSANKYFVKLAGQLIEILVATGHKDDAEKIQTQALAVLNDLRLKSAVSDAEQKVAKLQGK